MKKIRIIAAISACLLLFASCFGGVSEQTGGNDTVPGTGAVPSTDTTPTTAGQAETDEITTAADAEDKKVEITGDFTIVGDNSSYDGISLEGNVYTISKAGVYLLSGKLENGRIEIKAPDDAEVELDLKGCSISVSDGAPICALSADKLSVKAIDGTYNEISDKRERRTAADTDDEAGNGAIYAKCDLKICGKGALSVTGNYNNGIHSTKDVTVKNLTLKVNATNNALKGNDSVTIESGDIILISTGGNGIKTDDSDVSKKGNQRGTVAVSGGNVTVYAACDGIDAAYNAEISSSANVVINTDKYSDYSSEIAVSGSSEFYLIIPKANYSTAYRYSAYYYNDDDSKGVFADAVYSTMVSSGRTQYYGLKLNAPSGYSHVCFFRFSSSAANSTQNYDARSDSGAINTAMNAWLLSSVNNKLMSGDWVSMTTSSSSRNPGGPGGPGGGSKKENTTYSCKGIKAANAIIISGGTIVIQSTDDGLHANNDTTLENGQKAAGTVDITGGSITITSGDDGIHGDSTVTVDGGKINVLKSYEGIEAVTLYFKSGTTYVYASDDGINACTGSDRSKTPMVYISGGYLDVTTGSGDTDGIDSNGSITISGGFTLVKGGSAQGMVAGSVDCDGKITVTGGTIVALGGICELPGNSQICTVTMNGKSFQKGDYVISCGNEELITFSLESSYSNAWICSDKFSQGQSYVLKKDGASFTEWKQSSVTTQNGSAVSGGGGPGGGFRR